MRWITFDGSFLQGDTGEAGAAWAGKTGGGQALRGRHVGGKSLDVGTGRRQRTP